MKQFPILAVLLCIVISLHAQDGTFADPRDGQEYKSIEIGEQVWMAENLNYDMDSSWCYDDDPANCEVYGRLYNWEAAMNSCPEGWHLSSWDEWLQLYNYLGEDTGTKIRTELGWNNNNGTNSSGFSGLPSGRWFGWSFRDLGEEGDWWTATEYDARSAYKSNGIGDKGMLGLSIRCVQD